LIVDLLLCNAKVHKDNSIVDCNIAINNGKIYKIGKRPNMPQASKRIDLEDLLVLPGLIDAHVHLRDEKKAYEEDFYSGTAAAAAGGITTVLDMPNNDPVTMSVENLKNRMRLAENKVLVNVGFFSEFPDNTAEIPNIIKEGAVAFKLYMANQVGGLNIDDDNALSRAFKTAGKFDRVVAVHAEDKNLLKEAENRLKIGGKVDVQAFLEAHSENVEENAVKRLLNITAHTNTRLHFCHVSTEKGLKAIVEGKKAGLPVTCEVTPHHLLLSRADLQTLGFSAITMPPVREKHHIMALWNGLMERWIDTVGSDHAPHTLKEKRARSVWDVKTGIPELETVLPLLLTEVKHGRLSVGDVVRLMSERPAEIFDLKSKGGLKNGNDADLTVVDLSSRFKIDASGFYSKAKYSPFDRRIMFGKPVRTFVNGCLVMDGGEIVAKAGSGRIMRGK
jgi:dihydroorotase